MCFLYESWLAQLSSTEPSVTGLSTRFYLARVVRKTRAPCGCFRYSTVTSTGPLRRQNVTLPVAWAHFGWEHGSTQGKPLHRTVLSQQRVHSCMRTRLMLAHFRGCEKRGGIPFEAGSSAVRKSGLQWEGRRMDDTPTHDSVYMHYIQNKQRAYHQNFLGFRFSFTLLSSRVPP